MHNHFERLIKLKFFVSKGVVEESDGLLSKGGGGGLWIKEKIIKPWDMTEFALYQRSKYQVSISCEFFFVTLFSLCFMLSS